MKHYHEMFIIRAVLFCVLLLLSACAGHQDIMESIKVDLKANKVDVDNYRNELAVKEGDKNYLLYKQEAARVGFIVDDTLNSTNDFKSSIDFYNFNDGVSAFNTKEVLSNTLASTLLDDNTLIYYGSDYERAFTYFYTAINYLKQNNLQDSLIFIRGANNIQNKASTDRERKIIQAEGEIASMQFKLSEAGENYVRSMQKIRASAKNGFLNAYIYYLSGQIRELNKDYNGALVDYIRALELYPNNRFILNDALRLSAIYNRSYQRELIKIHGNLNYIKQSDYQKYNRVLVIFEQGFVPNKNSTNIKFFVSASHLVSISLPIYLAKQESLVKVSLVANTKVVPFQEVANVYTMAKNDLAENYMGTLIRQASRATSRALLSYAGSDSNSGSHSSNPLALLSTFSALTEQADLRSYTSLPSYVQVAKIESLESIENIRLKYNTGKSLEIKGLDLSMQGASNIAIIYVVDTGSFVYYNVIYKGFL